MRLLSLAFVIALACAPLGARAERVSTQRVSGQTILRLAGDALKALPADANHTFIPATVISDQVVPSGTIAMHAGTPVSNASYVNVPVDIDVNGSTDRTVYVGYRIQRYVETAVAAHDIAPGTVLSQDDLVMQRIPFTGRGGNGTELLVGRRTNGAILQGQAVGMEMTSVNQVVKAGSTVLLIVRDGGVALTADVIARTSGGIGDQVYVWNASTHKALSGTVTAPNTVELNISEGDSAP
ncbi:MAG: flagellar basal body P-ring formation protein FlgA [Candidatus Eremiobacteraeota bacterium]|nr:flagellar basal body P-ring formation protein FlgA [Candidatus Eremiobacteraeota bacterium]